MFFSGRTGERKPFIGFYLSRVIFGAERPVVTEDARGNTKKERKGEKKR
jgi:hypothetical protein